MSSVEKEIDLVQFLVDFIQFLKAGKKVILSFLLISILLSFFYYKYKSSIGDPNIYENSLILTSTVVQNDLIVDILNSIDKFDFSKRAKQLRISEELSEKVTNIEVVLIPFLNSTSGEFNNSKIELKIRYHDKKAFTVVVKSMLKYCDNNLYLKSKLKTFLTQNIKSLELVKRTIKQPEKLDVQFLEGDIVFKSNSFELFYLLRQKQNIEAALNKAKLISVININNDVIYSKPYSFKVIISFFVFIGLSTSILALFSTDIYKKIVLRR